MGGFPGQRAGKIRQKAAISLGPARVVTDCLIWRGALQPSPQPRRHGFWAMILRCFGGHARSPGALCGLNHLGPRFLWMRLERRVGAMSTLGGTVALCAMAVVMASLVH